MGTVIVVLIALVAIGVVLFLLQLQRRSGSVIAGTKPKADQKEDQT